MVTIKYLCEKYGITRATINNWRKEGMPQIQLGPKNVIFDEVAVEAWVAANKRRY